MHRQVKLIELRGRETTSDCRVGQLELHEVPVPDDSKRAPDRLTPLLARILLVLVFLLSTRVCPSQDLDLPDFNVNGAYPTFDLAELPLSVTLLQQAGVSFRDAVIDRSVRSSIDSLQPIISDVFKTAKAGYLVSVNIYIDEFGTAVIPGGQLITPIGVGLEPVDALAEFDMKDQLTVPPPVGLRDQSFFFWFVPKQGKLTATLVPHEFRASTELAAQQEARRRHLLADWAQAFPQNGATNIKRADYWVDAYERAKDRIGDATLRGRIEALNTEAQKLQSKLNDLYRDYNDTVCAMAGAQHDLQTLHTVTTVVSLVSDGIKVGEVIYGTDGTQKPVSPNSTSIKPSDPIDDLLIYKTTTVQTLDGLRIRQDIEIRGNTDAFRSLEEKIKDQWKGSGVPVPDPPPIPLY